MMFSVFNYQIDLYRDSFPHKKKYEAGKYYGRYYLRIKTFAVLISPLTEHDKVLKRLKSWETKFCKKYNQLPTNTEFDTFNNLLPNQDES